MRVLGACHLVQAGAVYRLGGNAREIGTVVDLLHGATSVVFSIVSPLWRRAALIDAVVATGFAVLGATNGWPILAYRSLRHLGRRRNLGTRPADAAAADNCVRRRGLLEPREGKNGYSFSAIAPRSRSMAE